MSIHVDELSSEIQVEPEPAAPKGGEEMVWSQRERLQAMMARLQRDAQRTRSRGYDD